MMETKVLVTVTGLGANTTWVYFLTPKLAEGFCGTYNAAARNCAAPAFAVIVRDREEEGG